MGQGGSNIASGGLKQQVDDRGALRVCLLFNFGACVTACKGGPRLNGRRQSLFGSSGYVSGSSNRSPVSYTHLDVYKRQGTKQYTARLERRV